MYVQSVDENVMFKTKMQEPPHPDLRRVEGLPTADGFTGCKRSEASSFSESEGCCGCAFFSRLRLAGFGVAAGGAAAGCAAGCSGLVFTAAGLALGSGCCSAAAAAAGGASSMGSPCRSAASPAGVAAAAGAAGVPVTAAVGAAGPPGSASAAGDASCGEASLLTLRPRPLPRPPRPRPLPLPLPLPPLPSHGATQASQVKPPTNCGRRWWTKSASNRCHTGGCAQLGLAHPGIGTAFGVHLHAHPCGHLGPRVHARHVASLALPRLQPPLHLATDISVPPCHAALLLVGKMFCSIQVTDFTAAAHAYPSYNHGSTALRLPGPTFLSASSSSSSNVGALSMPGSSSSP